MSREKLPAGCAVPILIAVAVLLYFSTRDSPEEIKRQEEEHSAFLKKYDYNPDSLVSSLAYSNLSSPDVKLKLKGKLILIYSSKGKLLFNPESTSQLPDDLIAYRQVELQTIVLIVRDNARVSEWGAHGVFREQAEISFIDYPTKQLVYTTILLGNHKTESKGRRGSTTYLELFEPEIFTKIIQINNGNGL